MDKFIENIIDESFASKKQQRYFFAKANDESLSKKEKNKWKKMSKEFSKKTNFKKLPEKVEVDEIVDDKGNISRKTIPLDYATKGATSKSTTDEVVPKTMPQMGSFGVAGGTNGNRALRYWTEVDLSKSLGYDETLKKDKSKNYAKKFFKKDLNLDDEESEERLEKMGYDDDLPKDKIRIIEYLEKYVEEYLENILPKKTTETDILEKEKNTESVSPIVKKQISAIKKTLEKNGISIKDFINMVKNE